MSTMTPEMSALKARLKAVWMAGDYGVFARYMEPGALVFLDRLDVAAGTRMLDIGCGAGQIAIPAALTGVHVTGIDIATNLIGQARTRAVAVGADVHFDEGDAEMLPYADASFDLVVSLIGAMFAPRPELVVAEMLRVCRPAGRIAMASWTPSSFVGVMFRILARHVAPPALLPSPLLWGDEAVVRERFGRGVSQLRVTKHLYPFSYPFPPDEVVDFYRRYYGPMNRTFAALDAAGQTALQQDLVQLWTAHNRAGDGTTRYDVEYLEVDAIRR